MFNSGLTINHRYTNLTFSISNKDIDVKLLGLITFILLSNTVQAGIPAWSFSTNGSPIITVSATETATASYILSNNSKKSHRLVLATQTPAGISQTGDPCMLAAKSPANPNPTCTLTLNIDGSALPTDTIFGGPILCQANGDDNPNLNQCYQPSPSDRLVITRTTIPITPGATTLSTSLPSPAILALAVNKSVSQRGFNR
jgi:hypothetical protein